MDTRRFHAQLHAACRPLIPRGSPVICAVSGGGDSVALLHGLSAVARMRSCGWRLHVAHLDHGLPQDSERMSEFVERTASDLGLDCTMDRADVPALSEETGASIEEAGRKVRYAFLERVAVELGAKRVAVAHHADDQAETVLHRILRGTGVRGLAGMPVRRPIREGSDIELVRPLLQVPRDELHAYLRKRGIRFMHDETNDDVEVATRNRIRHVLLPLAARMINPAVVTALCRVAEQARRANQAVSEWARWQWPAVEMETHDGAICLDATALAQLPRAIQTEIIVLALESLGVGRKAIGFERIEAAADAGLGTGRRRRIELQGGVLVERRGRRLRFALTVRPKTPAARAARPCFHRRDGGATKVLGCTLEGTNASDEVTIPAATKDASR